MLMFGIKFLPPLMCRPLRAQGPQESHEDYSQFHFRRSSLFLGGEKVAGFLGGCKKVLLPVEVVPVKGEGEVVLGCFVETLTLKERQVAGGWLPL